MPSGKQVFLNFISKYSQVRQDTKDLNDVSEDIRVGLLLHGSTPPEAWFDVCRIEWASEKIETDRHFRQGMALKGKEIFLSDLLATLIQKVSIFDALKQYYPQVSEKEIETAFQVIWLMITSMEFQSDMESVEDGGKLDMDAVTKLQQGYRNYLKEFRLNPGEWLGVTDETYKEQLRKELDDIGS